MDNVGKENGKAASAGRSAGDAFFLHISPHREAVARRFGHLNANGIPTEHPVQKPVKSSSSACFSRLDGTWTYNGDQRNTSGSTPSLASSKPLFNVVDHSVQTKADQLSRSWQAKFSEPLFYNIANAKATADSGARLVKASKTRNLPNDSFMQKPQSRAQVMSPKPSKRVTTVQPLESKQRFRKNADVDAPHATLSASQETAPILLKGGHVINHDSILVADILIRGGKIAQIAKGIQCQDARVIDIEGKCVMPGGIDSHTHFGCQSMGVKSVDDFATGTKAALAGGTTTIINCVDSGTSESLMSSFEQWKKQADQQVYCDYALSVSVPKWSESSKKDMAELVKSHGVNSFKFSTASKSAPMLDDCELYETLKHCRQLGALARIHTEHGNLISMKEEELLSCQHLSIPEAFLQARPEQLEADCALRACSISQLAGCPLNLPFVMNEQVAKIVAQMKNKGVIVFGETTAACLAVNGNNYFHTSLSLAAAHVTSPPLRPDPTIANGLIHRLASGEVDIVSSGHCAFNNEQRSKTASGFGKIPQGVTGVEERLMILWQKGVNTGMLDPMRFVAVISSNAAKLFNLYPSKGRVAVDSDADLVVWDPFAEKILSAQNHWSKADCSIYEGVKCIGIPFMTIAGGKIAFEEGQVKVPAGSGKYINVAPFCPLPFSRIVMTEVLQAKTTMNNFEGQPSKVIPFISNQEFHTRPITMAGDRNMLDSSFALSGAQFNDSNHQKRTTPSKHPFISDQEFHTRPLTKAGGRNMFDSSFALSGAQVDDTQHQKRMTRITKPPGGDSHGLW